LKLSALTATILPTIRIFGIPGFENRETWGARLALSLLAYNLGNLWRRLALPRRIENWSLTSLRQRLVKTRGRLVKHARLLLAIGGRHLNRRRFGAMLGRIALLPVPTG
jgi:hypothetical protein